MLKIVRLLLLIFILSMLGMVYIDVTPTSPSSSATTIPSPHQDPITRSMMRKIHMGLSQDDQVNHGLFTLFTWAKEISKI